MENISQHSLGELKYGLLIFENPATVKLNCRYIPRGRQNIISQCRTTGSSKKAPRPLYCHLFGEKKSYFFCGKKCCQLNPFCQFLELYHNTLNTFQHSRGLLIPVKYNFSNYFNLTPLYVVSKLLHMFR